LRAAFLANPHPAAPALDALASRLGLGKSKSFLASRMPP
jgi:hypothetical protein